MRIFKPRSQQNGTFQFTTDNTEPHEADSQLREAELIRQLPGKWKLAAILLVIGIAVDLPWIHKGVWEIIVIRMAIAVSCLFTAWIASKCRNRSQAEWTVIGGTLLITVAFGMLGAVEEIYYNYTLAVYQILVFIIIFLPLRTNMYAILLVLAGVLWFGPLPWALGQIEKVDLWYGHAAGYVTYAVMLLAGNMMFVRLRRMEHEWRINLVQRAQQLETRTDEMIKENERRYERLLKLSPEPTILHCEDTIYYANSAFLQLAGVSSLEDVKGINVHTFTDPEHLDKAAAQFEMAIKGETLQFQEYRFVKRSGETIEVEACSIAVNNHAGKMLIQTVLRDLTARKRMEEKLGRSDKLSALGQLAAGVAHEIRNPLTSLKGFVQLLQAKNPDHKSYYDIMSAELDRINLIVGEFMLMAKPQQVEFKLHQASSILNHVLSLAESQANMGNIRLQSEYEPDLPPIRCDENQLKQVFINVLKNGMEAMPNGGVIRIQLSRKDNRISIIIADEGIGIPEEKLPKLGEPFFTTKDSGTGLGLSVCYRIVEAHKGRMFIRSKLNEGTTVEILLPCG